MDPLHGECAQGEGLHGRTHVMAVAVAALSNILWRLRIIKLDQLVRVIMGASEEGSDGDGVSETSLQ